MATNVRAAERGYSRLTMSDVVPKKLSMKVIDLNNHMAMQLAQRGITRTASGLNQFGLLCCVCFSCIVCFSCASIVCSTLCVIACERLID